MHAGPPGPFTHIPKCEPLPGYNNIDSKDQIPKILVFGVDWMDVVSRSKLFSELFEIVKKSNTKNDEVANLSVAVRGVSGVFPSDISRLRAIDRHDTHLCQKKKIIWQKNKITLQHQHTTGARMEKSVFGTLER